MTITFSELVDEVRLALVPHEIVQDRFPPLCISTALVRAGIASGLPTGAVARAIVGKGDRVDVPCNAGAAGRIIGDAIADGAICPDCAEVVLNLLDR